jgi:hypothetical protein
MYGGVEVWMCGGVDVWRCGCVNARSRIHVSCFAFILSAGAVLCVIMVRGSLLDGRGELVVVTCSLG